MSRRHDRSDDLKRLCRAPKSLGVRRTVAIATAGLLAIPLLVGIAPPANAQQYWHPLHGLWWQGNQYSVNFDWEVPAGYPCTDNWWESCTVSLTLEVASTSFEGGMISIPIGEAPVVSGQRTLLELDGDLPSSTAERSVKLRAEVTGNQYTWGETTLVSNYQVAGYPESFMDAPVRAWLGARRACEPFLTQEGTHTEQTNLDDTYVTDQYRACDAAQGLVDASKPVDSRAAYDFALKVRKGTTWGQYIAWIDQLIALSPDTTPVVPVPAAPPGTAPGATGRYVALGDSYSSGFGNAPYEPGTNLDGGPNDCQRSQFSAYAQKVKLTRFEEFRFHACAGAVTKDFFGPRNNVDDDPFFSEPAQLDNIDRQTRLCHLQYRRE